MGFAQGDSGRSNGTTGGGFQCRARLFRAREVRVSPELFIFLELAAAIRDRLHLPNLPFPIRPSRRKAVFNGSQVAFDEMVGELDLFLRSHPVYADRYRLSLGVLAYVAGVGAGRSGYPDKARACLEIGLRWNPGNLSLRANLALALQALGQREAALAQYEAILQDPAVSVSPLVWFLAARLYADLGHPRQALKLLQDCLPCLPDEAGYWDFLAEMEEMSVRQSIGERAKFAQLR